MRQLKSIVFIGLSLKTIRGFPQDAKHEAGHQLDRVQQGLLPSDWKPLSVTAPGVREIRIRDASGIYRVLYIAKFQEAIYVLHAFQKKTQKTNRFDIEISKSALNNVLRERKI